MLRKYKTYGLEIRTSFYMGGYHHDAFEIGISKDGVGRLSNSVVKAFEKANEDLLDEIKGSRNLVSVIKYQVPKKKK